MKVRFILSFLAALFIAGNMIAIESTERVERKLPLVLKGEVPTTTSRSIPVIPISASVSTDDNIVDTGCPLKLFKREVVEKFYLFEGMHRFLPTLAKINGFKVIEIPVRHYDREFGVSKYGVFNRCLCCEVDEKKSFKISI